MQKNIFKNFPKEIIKIVAVFSFLFLLPNDLYGATLFVSPSSGNYNLGERIVFRISVSSDKPFNAVSGSVQFSTSHFVIESVSKSVSVLNFWVTEPIFSNNTGIVNFEGVALGGFNGQTGNVVNVTVRTKNEGLGKVEFLSGQILANDGQGTNITDGFSGSLLNILKVEPMPTKKEEEKKEEVVVKESPKQVIEINSPEIKYGKKYGESAIIGQSNYPNAQVLVTFISESGSKIYITEKTDNFGAFYAIIPNILKSGTYTVRAVVILDDLSSSEPSNEIKVVAGNVIKDVNWRIWVGYIIILIVVVFLAWKYFGNKIKKIFPKIDKEVGEAQYILEKSFDVLNADIEELNDSLDDKNKNSFKKEKLKNLKQDLKDAEKVIKDEIDDIRSI